MKKNSDEGKCVGCKECEEKCNCNALCEERKQDQINSDSNNDDNDNTDYETVTAQSAAEPYDEYEEMEKAIQKGEKAVEEHLTNLRETRQYEYLEQAVQYLEQKNLFRPDLSKIQNDESNSISTKDGNERIININPRVNNWPIQFSLIDENDPILNNADLLVASECSAFYYDKFRQRFLGDRVLIMFCPKLDKLFKSFVQKFTKIFQTKNIQSITIVHMEVPCCAAIEKIIKKALKLANKVITLKDYTISLSGEII